MRVFSLLRTKKPLSVLGLVILCGFGSAANAGGCRLLFPNADGSQGPTLDFRFRNTFVTGAWYEISTLPANSLMADNTSTLVNSLYNCNLLNSVLRGKKLKVVYTPPPGAVPSGNGYVVQSSNVGGVGFRLQFPTATPGPAGTLMLALTAANVTLGGQATTPPFPIRSSLVRTGPIQPPPGTGAASQLLEFGSLGAFDYYSEDDVPSPGDTNRIVFAYDDQSVFSPYCSIGRFNGELVPNGSSLQIDMLPVDISAFAGIPDQGAISTAEVLKGWSFGCHGSPLSMPSVSFTTSFPGRADGVALPATNSPIGIQLLMNNTPVEFDFKYGSLAWVMNGSGDPGFGSFSTDDGVSWFTPPIGGGNPAVPIPLTFRYYKNGPNLVPGAFDVTYTMTLEIF